MRPFLFWVKILFFHKKVYNTPYPIKRCIIRFMRLSISSFVYYGIYKDFDR